MLLLRVARRGNSLASLACGSVGRLSTVSLVHRGGSGTQQSAAGHVAAPATRNRRRGFAAGANLDGVNLDGANLDGAYLDGANLDPAQLRAEAASALAESDDDGGLDAFGGPSFPYVPPDPCCPPKIVRKNGVDLLHDPLYNKGTAFTSHERERLKLRGLLPPRVLSMGSQARRFMLEYREGRDYVDPNEIEDSGISHESVRKWKALSELKDRNETLFYSVLCGNIEEMTPVVYTPTVGFAALNHHRLYRRPRGFYFSADDVGEMGSMIWNCPSRDVEAIVITDGSRILGLGDMGLNGLAIPQGKLDLYVAAGGFHPSRVLPIVLDVGCDNAELRSDPFYFGLKRRRIVGDDFFRIMDEVMRSLASRWPNCVIQFEDFSSDRASAILERYRDHHLCFNDDIQGTAATILGGVYSAIAAQGRPHSAIAEQRFVVAGAGSAGCGVSDMLLRAMLKHGLSEEGARDRFWMLDRAGLITEERAADPRGGVSPQAARFARARRRRSTAASSQRPGGEEGEGLDRDGETLLEVVRRVKPTVLIGLSGAGKIFTRAVLEAAAAGAERPVVFAASNPTSRAECTSSEAAAASGGRAIYASGSPQPDVTLVNEQQQVTSIASSQANNVFVFPGLGLAACLGATGTVSDGMLIAAAEALPALIDPADLARGAVYPRLAEARAVARAVAAEAMLAAHREGRLRSPAALAALERGGREELVAHIERRQYVPAYHSLIRLPVGVAE